MSEEDNESKQMATQEDSGVGAQGDAEGTIAEGAAREAMGTDAPGTVQAVSGPHDAVELIQQEHRRYGDPSAMCVCIQRYT